MHKICFRKATLLSIIFSTTIFLSGKTPLAQTLPYPHSLSSRDAQLLLIVEHYMEMIEIIGLYPVGIDQVRPVYPGKTFARQQFFHLFQYFAYDDRFAAGKQDLAIIAAGFYPDDRINRDYGNTSCFVDQYRIMFRMCLHKKLFIDCSYLPCHKTGCLLVVILHVSFYLFAHYSSEGFIITGLFFLLASPMLRTCRLSIRDSSL
jgi:hypothetical protein